jgi:hypothetical protein
MNKRFTLLYFAVALTAGIIVACSGEEAEKAGAIADVVAEPGEDTTAREFGYFEHSDKHPYNKKLLNAWKLAKKKATYVGFFCTTYNGILFLSQNKAEMYEEEKLYKSLRFGLIDDKGNELLPQIYEQIGNPGMIANEYVEVKKDGKFGLYNYAANKLIQPEYDVLYPSRIMEYVAIGQKGNQFYKIYSDGKSKAFKENQPAPNYARLLKDYRYNTDNEYFGYWTPTDPLENLGTDEFYVVGYGMTFIPSYLARLRIFEEPLDYNLLSWSEFGEDSTDLNVVDAKMRNDDVYSMLTSFYSFSSEARGYDTERRHLVTFDKKNRIRSSKTILEFSNGSLYNFVANDLTRPRVRFLNDSTVEVRSYVMNEVNGYDLADRDPGVPSDQYTPEKKQVPYQNYTKYEYYTIAADGTVKAIKDGYFPMTSAIVMTKEYLKGCFARLLTEEEAQLTELYDEERSYTPIYSYTDHLSLNDLEYMRNEIYARHGMKFKDLGWAAAFKAFPWYKPTRSNVGSLLTPIEKKNLQLIQQMEKEIRKNPDALIHETHEFMFMGA